MIKVKDGYAKLIGTTYSGSASRVLLSNGGDHILGNSNGNIPLNNGTVNTNLNADMLDGLHIHTGRNHEVNKIVRTDANGHILAGWINTTSGDIGTGTINKIYCSNDNYIRYKTPANFFPTLANSGNNISITVAGLNRTLTVGYATNADTVDGYHASSFLIDKGRDYNGLIYDLPCKSIFSGNNLSDAPTTGWVSGIVLGSNWNSSHYQHYLVEIDSRWYATRSSSDGKMTNWNTFAYLTDNVASASKWQTARKITLTGSITGSASIDGSENVTLTTTTNHTHNWTNIEDKPSTFAPSSHTHSYITISTCSSLDGNSNNFSVEYADGGNSVATKPSGVDAFGVMRLRTASGWYGLILMSTSKGIYYRSANDLTSSIGWIKLLDSSNSSVSGDGNAWGSSITVKINGTSKTLTIPSNPNTDYRVTQSETTTANYRPLVLGYTNVSTAGSGMTGSITNQVYLSNKFYVQPSTGNLYATTFVGALSGNATSATKLATARSIFGKSFNGTADVSGLGLFYGTYTSSADARYWKSGLLIRENGLVQNNLSDIGYAPSIGFHWGSKTAATMLLHSDGNFYFRKIDGVTRASLDANIIGNASTATALTSSAGSATTPIYFSNGKPVVCTYSLNKTVPSDAVFTDHTYNFYGVAFYSGNAGNLEHNANSAVSNGLYYYTSNGPTTTLGASNTDGALYVLAHSSSLVGQIALDYRNGGLYVRGKSNGTWTDWVTVLDSRNCSSYVSPKTHTHLVKINGITKTIAATSGTVVDLGTYLTAHQTIYDLTFAAGKFTAGTFDPNGSAKAINIPQKITHLTNNLFVKGTLTAATNAWTGTVDGLTDYYDGLTIDYYLPFAGTSTAATLNLNSLGAKTVYNGRGKGNTTTHFSQYSIIRMTYYGGAFYASAYYDSTYAGFVNGYCSTAATTAAKYVSATNFALTAGVNILVRFTQSNTVTSALTLNVNGTGAKTIYINGTVSSSSNYRFPAGTFPCYYDGTYWHIYTNGMYRFTNVKAGTFYGALDGNAKTATTASKLGSSTVGSGTKHFYLSSGTATASSSTVGGTAKPMYLNAGTMTAISATVGSASKPVYLNGGTITACSSSLTDYLPLTGGSLSGDLYVTKSDTSSIWARYSSSTAIRICASSSATYIQAGNYAWTNNVPMYLSGPGGNNGSILYLKFLTVDASGNILASHFYENSDIRYKKILKNLSINSNTISNLPLFDFEWIENNAIGTGTSALAVQQILPNLVSGTDKLTLDYGVLGTIAGITACKELVTLKSELLQLKEKVKLLEDKLCKYENI